MSSDEVRDARTRENPELVLPDPPALTGTLPVRSAPVERAGPVRGAAPFTHAGLRAAVVASGEGGVAALWVHPLRVVRRLEPLGAAALELASTPAGVERRLEIGGATVRERVAVPLALPAAIVEWELDPAAEAAVELRVAWRAEVHAGRGDAEPLEWRLRGRSLYTASRGGSDAALHAWSREPERWRVADDPDGPVPGLRCDAVVRLEPGQPVRMAVLATHAGPDALRSAVDALRRVDGVVHARTATVRRADRERLVVRAPDPVAGPAVEWARHRLAGYLAETRDGGRCLVAGYGPATGDGVEIRTADAVWTALACLASGDFDGPRETIRFLGARQDADGRIPSSCDTAGRCGFEGPDPTPLYLLLVGRFLAWSGDDGLIRREWPRITSAFAHGLRRDADGDGLPEAAGPAPSLDLGAAAVWTAAIGDLADAAETIGETGLAAQAREHARRAQEALGSTFHDEASGRVACAVEGVAGPAMDASRSGGDLEIGGGPARRRLPVVGAPAPAAETAPARPRWRHDFRPSALPALPLLLGVAGTERLEAWSRAAAAPPGAGPLEAGWIAWARFLAGQSDDGARGWHALAAPGLEHGTWGEGGCPDRARATAMVVLPLVCGLLGVEPDATRGRVRLAPRIPAGWASLEVSSLRVGDVRVRLRYAREGGLHRFFVEQQSGAVPINVVFEPHLPALSLHAARVDGQPADLDARRADGRLVVPVQIVLDEGRTIELETGTG